MNGVATFTVVTPSYNQAAYLPETIESVISQAGPFAIEYFIMDGGSTDGSVDIIRRYADRVADTQSDLRCHGVSLHWVSGRDNGQSDAINRGLRTAHGDVCSYLNSDDTYPPGALARVAEAFARHPNSDFIYGDGEVIDEESRLQWVWLSRPYNHRLLTSYHFAWNAFPNYIMQQATFWRRRVMDLIGYFDEGMHYAMDLEYWVRAGAAGLILTHVREKLGRFRMIKGTKSLSSPTAFWGDQLEVYRRHHGATSLWKYFTYYYYNVALCYDFDLDAAENEGERLLERWDVLDAVEKGSVRRAARVGLLYAALLAAITLQHKEDVAKACATYEFAIARDRSLHRHGLAALFQARAALGPQAVARMDRCWNTLVSWYRSRWIDYRYLETAAR